MTETASDDHQGWPWWRPFACISLLVVASLSVNYGMRSVTHFESISAWAGRNASYVNIAVKMLHYCVWLSAAYLLSPNKPVYLFLHSVDLYKRFHLHACYYSLLAVLFVLGEFYITSLGAGFEDLSVKKYLQRGEISWMLYVISTTAIGPFVEEVVIRGFIYRQLRKTCSLSLSIGIVLSVTLYFHWQLVASSSIAGVFLIFGGIILCIIREKTTSLWNCILFHSVHNASAIHQWSLIVLVLGILAIFARDSRDRQSCQSSATSQ